MSRGKYQPTMNSTNEPFAVKTKNSTNPKFQVKVGDKIFLKSREDIQDHSNYVLDFYRSKFYKRTYVGDICSSLIKAATLMFPSSVTFSRGL